MSGSAAGLTSAPATSQTTVARVCVPNVNARQNARIASADNGLLGASAVTPDDRYATIGLATRTRNSVQRSGAVSGVSSQGDEDERPQHRRERARHQAVDVGGVVGREPKQLDERLGDREERQVVAGRVRGDRPFERRQVADLLRRSPADALHLGDLGNRDLVLRSER